MNFKMGLWSIVEVLDKRNKWFTVKDVLRLSKLNKPNVLSSLRKAINKGFAIVEQRTKIINNRLTTYNVYKSKKFTE